MKEKQLNLYEDDTHYFIFVKCARNWRTGKITYPKNGECLKLRIRKDKWKPNK